MMDKEKFHKMAAALSVDDREYAMKLVAAFAGDNGLVQAVEHGDVDEVALRIKRGENVNDVSGGVTPLMTAASLGERRFVEMLLEAGADVHCQGAGGLTALMSAAQVGFFFPHAHLSSLGSSQAVTQEYPAIVRLLLEAGAQVDAVDETGRSALMMAADVGEDEVMDVLIRAGAQVNLQDEDGATALILAVESGSLDAVRCLLKAGADVSLADHDGCTPLSLAEEEGDDEMVEVLQG